MSRQVSRQTPQFSRGKVFVCFPNTWEPSPGWGECQGYCWGSVTWRSQVTVIWRPKGQGHFCHSWGHKVFVKFPHADCMLDRHNTVSRYWLHNGPKVGHTKIWRRQEKFCFYKPVGTHAQNPKQQRWISFFPLFTTLNMQLELHKFDQSHFYESNILQTGSMSNGDTLTGWRAFETGEYWPGTRLFYVCTAKRHNIEARWHTMFQTFHFTFKMFCLNKTILFSSEKEKHHV